MTITIAKRGSKANLLIKDARVFDPERGVDMRADVAVERGQISSIAPVGKGRSPHRGDAPEATDSGASGAEIIEAAGRLLVPGFVDLHTHLRTPGREDEEDLTSGTAAAAAGGYVTICAMPNTEPVVDNASVLSSLIERAEAEASVSVAFLGAISRGQEGIRLADIWDMAEAGAVAFSDDGRPVTDGGLLRAAFQAAKLVGLPLVLHCEDSDLAATGVMNESEVSARLGLAGIPCSAESAAAARDLEIAAYEDARVHIAHVSCVRTLGHIRRAREGGVTVTCEVTPHHLTLSDEEVFSLDANLKMNPPLRSEADRQALVEALAAGDMDCIATDHAPHAPQEKETPFEEAAFGTLGLETAFPVLYTRLVESGGVPLERLVAAMSTGPARAVGLPEPALEEGEEANLALIDTEEEFDIEPARFQSKSRNSAFSGQKAKGKVKLTVAAGRVAYRL
ncbi:MAG: dihydroorotase [Thermoleophilia bacterium]|nr:dihydroorotase [Thermoleophilia bacterium]